MKTRNVTTLSDRQTQNPTFVDRAPRLSSTKIKRKNNVLPIAGRDNSRSDISKKISSDSVCKGVVGILTKTFRGSYYGRMVQRIVDFMQEHGYLVIVQSCDLGEGELEKWLHLQANQCDGLIIQSDSLSDESLSDILYTYPSAILMNRYVTPHQDRCIYLDNKIGGMLAANYLLEHGHRSVAMVTGPSGMCEVNERSAGFKSAIQGLPDASCVMQIESDFKLEGGARAMENIINSGESVTAVFFHNDDMAFGALSYCQRVGVSIPDEYSLIGYDDLVSCEYSYPRLTSIRQPLEEIGDAAAKMMYHRLSDNAQKKMQSTPPQRDTYFLPNIAERDSVTHIKPDSKELSLSDRELECLTWTAKGKTSWEISIILGIAECTVSFHLRSIGKKLSSNNRTHSVAIALELGLIKT